MGNNLQLNVIVFKTIASTTTNDNINNKNNNKTYNNNNKISSNITSDVLEHKWRASLKTILFLYE